MSKQILTTWPEAATKAVVEKTLEEKAAALTIKPKSSGNMVTKEAAPAEPKKKKFVFIVLLIIILGVVLIGGGVFAYRKIKSKKEIPLSTPEAVISLTQAPEEQTPTPELKRSDLSVQALNGSGEAGVAGEAQEFLEDLGYEGVEAGNADSYDYEETEISIKEGKKAYLEMLITDLETEYALATETGTLDEEIEFDAVITIGEK